ncbi:hypothetical protein BaRGS_00019426 [Batillaria attramentaria]|uniref:Uncharacterized protein n=1 Tax=Batillaria attramentaria TaxID=370345 RepID=A0ABD0KR02_9CAEN
MGGWTDGLRRKKRKEGEGGGGWQLTLKGIRVTQTYISYRDHANSHPSRLSHRLTKAPHISKESVLNSPTSVVSVSARVPSEGV